MRRSSAFASKQEPRPGVHVAGVATRDELIPSHLRADDGMVRTKLAMLVVVLLQAGCGGVAPPDTATSERLVTTTVLDWHRQQAARDGDAACRLLTDKQKAAVVELHARISRAIGKSPPGDCSQAITRGSTSSQFQQLMLNTRVDAVRVEGERATATAHTTAAIDGIERRTPPVEIPLRWADGRWLID
jgi:hypothetical protein